MGRDLVPPLSNVDRHGPFRVDWVPFVGVDCDAEEAEVGLEIVVMVTLVTI